MAESKDRTEATVVKEGWLQKRGKVFRACKKNTYICTCVYTCFLLYHQESTLRTGALDGLSYTPTGLLEDSKTRLQEELVTHKIH